MKVAAAGVAGLGRQAYDVTSLLMEVRMGDLLIRNVPEALKSDLERHAARSGRTLDVAVVEALRAGLSVFAENGRPREPSLPPGQRLIQIALESRLGSEAADDDDAVYQTTISALRRDPHREWQPD